MNDDNNFLKKNTPPENPSRRNILIAGTAGAIGSLVSSTGNRQLTIAKQNGTAPKDSWAYDANAYGTGLATMGAGTVVIEATTSPEMTRRDAAVALAATAASMATTTAIGRHIGEKRMEHQEPPNNLKPYRDERNWQAKVTPDIKNKPKTIV